MYQPEKKAWPPTYHMLKHFYNTIPPGSVRVGVTPAKENRVSAVAFLLPDKRNLSVVFINEQGSRRSVDLRFKGFTAGSAVVHESDTKRRFERAGEVKITDGGATVALSPLSVTSVQLRSR